MRDIKRSNLTPKTDVNIDAATETFANKAGSSKPDTIADTNLDPSAPRNAGKLSMPLNAFEKKLLNDLKTATGMSMNTIVRQAIMGYAEKHNLTV